MARAPISCGRAPQGPAYPRRLKGFIMSRVPNLNSPFLLGFDDIERALDRVTRTASDGYPPYNIERLARDGTDPERLRITLAVAGVSHGQHAMVVGGGEIHIRGREQG